MAKIVPLNARRRSAEGARSRVVGIRGCGSVSSSVVVGDRAGMNSVVGDVRQLKGELGQVGCELHQLRTEPVQLSRTRRPGRAVLNERDERYKRRAQVLLYQAASLLAEVEGSEQRLAWLLEDCADLLVREEQMGPVA